MSFALVNATLNGHIVKNQSDIMYQPRIVIEPFTVVTIALCVTIIITGCLGNLMAVAVFGGAWLRARSCGVYLINMAFANLIGTTVIPSELLLEVLKFGVRPIGDVGCKITSFLSITSISVTSFTLVAVSVDRYTIMKCPSRATLSRYAMPYAITTIWILGSSFGVIYLLGDRLRLYDVGDISVCRSFAPYNERLIHTVVTFVLQVALPMFIMLVLYASMLQRIRSRSRNALLKSADNPVDNLKRDKQAVKILLIVVIVFFACHVPVNVYYFLDLFGAISILPQGVTIKLYTFLHLVQMSSNCINPVIYFAFNKYLDSITTDNRVKIRNDVEYVAE